MTRWWVTLALIAAVCVSCSSVVAGVPAPNSAEPRIPPRPKELLINGIDPCGILTADQLRTLRVSFSARSEPLDIRGPGCRWSHSSSEPIEAYDVAVNTNGGVEVVFGQADLQVLTIAGFGAVETPGAFTTGKDNCFVHVDVAPRQALQISYFYNGTTEPVTHEIACGKARNAAELAMQTVLAKVGG